MDLLNLKDIAGGALYEKANDAMQRILENMQDPNTPYKAKRSITIKLGFVQNESRDNTAVDISVETKLAPASPVQTMMAIGKNLKNGEVYAEEYGKQIRGQLSFEDLETQQIGEDTVDTETREVIGNNKVVGMRKAAL